MWDTRFIKRLKAKEIYFNIHCSVNTQWICNISFSYSQIFNQLSRMKSPMKKRRLGTHIIILIYIFHEKKNEKINRNSNNCHNCLQGTKILSGLYSHYLICWIFRKLPFCQNHNILMRILWISFLILVLFE